MQSSNSVEISSEKSHDDECDDLSLYPNVVPINLCNNYNNVDGSPTEANGSPTEAIGSPVELVQTEPFAFPTIDDNKKQKFMKEFFETTTKRYFCYAPTQYKNNKMVYVKDSELRIIYSLIELDILTIIPDLEYECNIISPSNWIIFSSKPKSEDVKVNFYDESIKYTDYILETLAPLLTSTFKSACINGKWNYYDIHEEDRLLNDVYKIIQRLIRTLYYEGISSH